MSIPSSTTPAIVYPETDGEPMAENTIQYRWIVTIKEGLEGVFESRPDVFVAADLFWYPVEGESEIRAAPDVMVVLGRPKRDRPSYMQWEEGGVPPDVVFEILSPSNRPTAMKDKLRFYEQYGVSEYYVYDPDKVEFKGFIRSDDALRPIPNTSEWTSPLLDVRFDLSGPELVILDPKGERFLTVQEIRMERDQERNRSERLAAQLRAAGIEPAS